MLDKQIKEKIRIVDESARIKRAILDVRVDANVLVAELKVNETEAAHNSMFVAGWRPFVGWVCGVSLLYHFLLSPLMVFIFTIAGTEVILPAFEFSQLSSILMGMLGLGGLRTFEKMKGVNREK